MEVKNLQNQRLVNDCWVEWLELEDWDVFATLNFGCLGLLRGDKTDAASKLWRSCLNALDRAIYGQARKYQPRFQRVAFRQFGVNGNNPHVHILAKSPIEPKEFCVAWNAIWASKFIPSANIGSNSIAPIISTRAVAGYLQHEEFKSHSGAFDERLSYWNSGTQHTVRTDALERLHTQANPTKLIQARLAFHEHTRKSQANFERRNRFNTAAMLRH
jgi:hypothetical protein